LLKRNLAILLLGLFLLTSVLSNKAIASWAGFSTEEVIQKSDVILIGEIVGPVGEVKRPSQGLPDTWVTYWNVKVHYYLKGSQDREIFRVTTPGAENKSLKSSIDYRLDKWGKTVLLFLQQREGIFEPLSPQGVVVLETKDYAHKQGEQINGQTILKEFTIVNPQINDRSVLEKYITDNRTVMIPKPGTKESSSNQKTSNSKTIITIFLATIVLVVSDLWFMVKHLKKG
jgi:hypothetical protein